MQVEVRPFSPSSRGDFFDLHSTPPMDCFCSYWWLNEGEDWSKLTAAENRSRREQLLERGEYDGYLAYVDGKVVGWCQVGPRDRLGQLRRRMKLEAEPGSVAITCFYILPGQRRKGVASALLSHVLTELKAKGVRRVQAFPRRGESLTVDDMWNGPEPIFLRAGFEVVRDDAERPVMEKRFE